MTPWVVTTHHPDGAVSALLVDDYRRALELLEAAKPDTLVTIKEIGQLADSPQQRSAT